MSISSVIGVSSRAESSFKLKSIEEDSKPEYGILSPASADAVIGRVAKLPPVLEITEERGVVVVACWSGVTARVTAEPWVVAVVEVDAAEVIDVVGVSAEDVAEDASACSEAGCGRGAKGCRVL